MALVLYWGSKLIFPMMEGFGNYEPHGWEEMKQAENRKLLDDFVYVGDKEYVVETKGIQGLVDPFSGEEKSFYYIGVQEEGTEYLLAVTKEIYDSVGEKESIVMQAGEDGRYMLSEAGEVVVKHKVDKQ